MSDTRTVCIGCFEKEASGLCPRCGGEGEASAFPTALLPGTVLLDRYRVGQVLGNPGGFGVTYLAFDLNLHRRLALKELMPRDLVARKPDRATLEPHTKADAGLFAYTRDAFLNEARTLAQFTHPNVVRVHDYFEANGTAYFTMEYYEGESLAARVDRRGGSLDGRTAVGFMLPVLEALGAVHDRGVLHRDVKPSNIYVTDGGEPILLDFGSARRAMGERTQALTSVLTPGFAPFEQYHDRGDQGPWTDVYGCAATLYALISGSAPTNAPSRIAREDLAPLHEVADVPEALSAVIASGLALDPCARPATTAAFAQNLTEALDGPNRVAAPDLDRAPFDGADSAPTGRSAPDERARATSRSESAMGWPARVGTAVGLALCLLVAVLAPRILDGGSRAGDVVVPLQAAPPPTTPVNAQSAAVDPGAEPGPAESTRPDLAVGPAGPEEAAGPVPPEGDQPPAATGRSATEVGAGTRAAPTAAEADLESGLGSPASAPLLPDRSTLVVVRGDPLDAERAEAVLQRRIARATDRPVFDVRGLEVFGVSAEALGAALDRGVPGLAQFGRTIGADLLLVGELTSEARASVGSFHTGSARLDVTLYALASGRILDARLLRVGGGGAPGVLGQSASDATSGAVEEVATAAARVASRWVSR